MFNISTLDFGHILVLFYGFQKLNFAFKLFLRNNLTCLQFQHSRARARGRCISLSSRPARSTEGVPGWPGIHTEKQLSRNTKTKKGKRKYPTFTVLFVTFKIPLLNNVFNRYQKCSKQIYLSRPT